MKNIILFALSLICLISTAHAATNSRVLCATPKGGLIARGKCRAGETQLELLTLISSSVTQGGISQGPQGLPGPKGADGAKGKIDFSACHFVEGTDSNFSDGTVSTVTASATCDQNTEFVFDEKFSFFISPSGVGTKVFIQNIDKSTSAGINGETLPFKVEVTANRMVSAGNGLFILATSALCCPR